MKFDNRESFLRELDLMRREKCKIVDFRSLELRDMDLSGEDLRGVDFSWSTFENVSLRNADLGKSKLEHIKFIDVDLSNSNLEFSSLIGGDFRGCNLSNANCDGADFTSSQLVGANLEGLKSTDRTIHFRNHCPQDGYIFGYKKCFNNRIVKLLIPKDSKRCSSTTNACRCEKAWVVAITDENGEGFYTEAVSFVDENFIYRLGELAVADSYHEDRWLDSSHGIHFWLTFEEALGYM